ncbi:MAG: hypothetical protein K5905_27250, partial [Roseibium sp.]|uniref:hypothetical protein n=1 Tax=Roseibium sp. TaxID=1936156 RepID=UPI002628BAE5
VRRGLQSGVVDAVSFDDPVEQGRLAIRVAVSAQHGVYTDELVGPAIELLTASSLSSRTILLAPASLELNIE